ncbi:MFS transporter [Chelatococcus reniformis]|uniref:Fosmidomycin resistance protein n=1 Tax=Chelatococcus reniformis TaxID=1494448 RepID=A0A916UNU2_9HYPH|nr:MFS transporter [Chelatococcus reniformis]GGC79688.1 fosmidomycin resistance protein [Chelatococcus reniformis]
MTAPASVSSVHAAEDRTAFRVLAAISFSHLLNDLLQSLLPAIYPILKVSYNLDFAQVGLITLCFYLTSSLFQPLVGFYTDKRPSPFSLAIGMGCSLLGLLLMAVASSFSMILIAAMLVGSGSAVFHPEASRVARMGSGGRHGLAQSFFQVGGNVGTALGPLLAAFIVVPRGQSSLAYFSVVALLGMFVLFHVGRWYRDHVARMRAKGPAPAGFGAVVPRNKLIATLIVLGLLIFSKFFYTASISTYYTFFLIHKFGLSVPEAQLYLFLYLGAVAVGTIIGGPLGDRFGRKPVIWFSILGVLPFSLALPHADLTWTPVLTVIIGLILSSAFPAIIVYAQELMPGKVGMIAGLFFGFAFGMGGIGAAVLGELADATSIEFVYKVCAFLPMIGLLAWFLPHIERNKPRLAAA